MTRINFNFGEKIKEIKEMNSVGQPPLSGISDEHFHYLTEANMRYSRLHDTGGLFGGNIFVDIPNIFRNFDADETDPQAYDFAFTDILIKELFDADCEPIFRLGVSIENYQHIRAYNIYPPKDYGKWARICEHIIRHYREGWADGFHYDITYWEIWNEPDFEPNPEKNQMWKGTPEEFYSLYAVAAKHLKNCFGEKIKVGGYGSCGFYGIFADPEKYGMNVDKRTDNWTQDISHVYHIDFFHGFLEYVKKENAPLDFFSWHSYCSVSDAEYIADYTDKILTEYGYGDIETMLNEWNPTFGYEDKLKSSEAVANAAAMMCAMQNKKTTILCYYDARMRSGWFGGLFNAYTAQPFNTYYAFVAFGEMIKLKNQVKADFEQIDGLYAIATSDGSANMAMIVNISEKEINISTNAPNMKVYVIDNENAYTKAELNSENFTIKSYQVIVLKQ